MSANDHYVATSGDVVTGALSEEELVSKEIGALQKRIEKLRQERFGRELSDIVRQSQVTQAKHEQQLRFYAGAWATEIAANCIADVVEALIMAKADPKLVQAVARMADEEAILSARVFDLEIRDVRSELANRPVAKEWIGARGEGDRL